VTQVTARAPLGPEQLAVYFALLETSSLLQYALEQQVRRDADLSFVQFQILAGLNFIDGGRQRMTDIADRVVYSRSGLTYQARELEKRGLVERLADPDDERATVVAITAAGRRVIRQVLPDHEDVVRQTLLDHLSERDAATLTRILGTLRDRMRTQPPRSARARRSS
jgi:DNA-binding MarR family transcriptional regulator